MAEQLTAGLGIMQVWGYVLITDEMALDKLQNSLGICFLTYKMEIMSLPGHNKFVTLPFSEPSFKVMV